MNILVNVFWWNNCSYFPGRFIGGDLLGHRILYFQLGRHCQMIFQNGGLLSVFNEKGVSHPSQG